MKTDSGYPKDTGICFFGKICRRSEKGAGGSPLHCHNRTFSCGLVSCESSRSSQQADSVLSQDFKVRGQTRILRCEVVVQRSGERQEEKTKTPGPYSLDINLITTQLGISANRCAVNRFPWPLSECTLNSSRCVAPGRWLLHDLTYQLESLAFCQFLVF